MVVDTPCAEVLADVPADVPELDELLELPVGRLGVRGHARRWARPLRSVAGRRWDPVLDAARNERAQLLVALSRARRRVVLVPVGRRPGRGARRTRRGAACDSGPMHLAAAVGTPVCALVGSESPVTWAPLGTGGHRTFHPELPCGAACANPGVCVPGDRMKAWCILRIPVEEVQRAVSLQPGEATAPSVSRPRGAPV